MNALFLAIESHRFGALAGLASGVRTFLSIIRQQSEVQELDRKIRKEKPYRKVLQRVRHLCTMSVDPRFENPWDTALAVYLLAIHRKNNADALAAAETLRSINNIFWAGYIAEAILKEDNSQETSTIQQVDFEHISADFIQIKIKGPWETSIRFADSWPNIVSTENTIGLENRVPITVAHLDAIVLTGGEPMGMNASGSVWLVHPAHLSESHNQEFAIG